jgi:lipopolysaccharide/colanic/teichoic acid biosynthesis glycosyltransferase/glycosyltransferase involved in cell wall biosynthesis
MALARLESSTRTPDPLRLMNETDFNVVVSAKRLAVLYDEACVSRAGSERCRTTPSMTLASEIGAATGVGISGNPPLSQAKPKILAICNVDLMAWVILKQWFIGLQEAGYDVHIACAPGEYWGRLGALGFQMHPISIRRTLRPWAHVRPIFEVMKLARKGGFAAVNAHSAVGGGVGRIAAWLAGVPCIAYTVHGFYFHENMPAVPRSLLIAIEWFLGRFTSGFMFVSAEDSRTGIRTGIVPAKSRSLVIFNGVDLNAFSPRETCLENTRSFKRKLGIDDATPVVGIVARIVREKGYREFLEMACRVVRKRKAVFLVVGDTLPSDRDQFGESFKKEVAKAGLAPHFLFAGQTNLVADHLRIMDMFVLPSHREGFPRSIVEAMSAGLPVVATDIRGCREAVVHGKTGLIVPPKNGKALADAVEHLLANPEEAAAMGHAGRERAVHLYDYRTVQAHFVEFINQLISNNCKPNIATKLPEGPRALTKLLKRFMDLTASLILLVVLAPLMLVIALAVICESPGGASFRQRRAGFQGREFEVIKFRSMRPSQPGQGHANRILDPRITRLGGLLRRTSLDELPQLFNVLAGDMSLVGPRPLLLQSIRPNERIRLEMRPGITGLAAVSGRQSLTWDERMALDRSYVENWTLWLDMRILWRTIPVALSQANVYDSDGETKARP